MVLLVAYKNLPRFSEDSYAHFVTTRTCESRPYFEGKELCQIFIEELEFYRKKYGFALMGYVIMPDHVYLLLWWDKEGKPGLSISKIMNSIKTMTTKRIKRRLFYNGGVNYLGRLADVSQPISESRNSFRLWQPSFYDFNIHSEEKLLEKLDYIHNNPVKAGLASSPCDYKWSSHKDYFKEESQTFNEVLIGEHA